jgi:hypothetical protein
MVIFIEMELVSENYMTHEYEQNYYVSTLTLFFFSLQSLFMFACDFLHLLSNESLRKSAVVSGRHEVELGEHVRGSGSSERAGVRVRAGVRWRSFSEAMTALSWS